MTLCFLALHRVHAVLPRCVLYDSGDSGWMIEKWGWLLPFFKKYIQSCNVNACYKILKSPACSPNPSSGHTSEDSRSSLSHDAPMTKRAGQFIKDAYKSTWILLIPPGFPPVYRKSLPVNPLSTIFIFFSEVEVIPCCQFSPFRGIYLGQIVSGQSASPNQIVMFCRTIDWISSI